MYRYFSGIARSDDPVFMAVAYLSVWNFIWIFNLISLTDLLGYKIDFGSAKVSGVGMIAVLYLINYFLFWHNNKYEDIEKRFRKTYSGVLNPWIATFMVILPFLILSVLIYLHVTK